MIYKDEPKTKEEAFARLSAIFCPVILELFDEKMAAEVKASKTDNHQEAA
ncbi:MAG: hypothetical protein ACYC27_02915 [Armatimonadota bacterium]